MFIGDHIGQIDIGGITTPKSDHPSRFNLRNSASLVQPTPPQDMMNREPDETMKKLNEYEIVLVTAPSRSAVPGAIPAKAAQILKSIGLRFRVELRVLFHYLLFCVINSVTNSHHFGIFPSFETIFFYAFKSV